MMFICAIEQNALILCEKHAKAFEAAALVAKTPHTIYEMDEDEALEVKCHACDLQNEIIRPRLIIPN